jgi:hypothetical protein
MKKTLALAILGVAAVTTAFGQGHVLVSNYLVAPYNQVVWGPGTPGNGNAVVDNAAVRLQLFYGAALDQVGSVEFGVNPGLMFDPGAGKGGGGYFDAQVLLTATPGTYDAVLRVVGPAGFFGESAPFQVTTISTSLPAETAPVSPGLIVAVPEPSTFALAGLGAAALLIFRRRA